MSQKHEDIKKRRLPLKELILVADSPATLERVWRETFALLEPDYRVAPWSYAERNMARKIAALGRVGEFLHWAILHWADVTEAIRVSQGWARWQGPPLPFFGLLFKHREAVHAAFCVAVPEERPWTHRFSKRSGVVTERVLQKRVGDGKMPACPPKEKRRWPKGMKPLW